MSFSPHFSTHAPIFQGRKVPDEGVIVGYAAIIQKLGLKVHMPSQIALVCHQTKKYKTLSSFVFPWKKCYTFFATKNNLPYSLLVDEDKEIISAYGVWGPKKFMGREYDGIHRTTFVIDESGNIENIIHKVKTKEHAVQIL